MSLDRNVHVNVVQNRSVWGNMASRGKDHQDLPHISCSSTLERQRASGFYIQFT